MIWSLLFVTCVLFFSSEYNAMMPILPHLELRSIKISSEIVNINQSEISDALAILKNPFSKEEKLEQIGHLLTGDPLFDKGMFQAYVLEKFCNGIRDLKIRDYLLYKTIKYSLETLQKIIAAAPQMKNRFIYRKNLINTALINIQYLFGYKLFRDQISTEEFVLVSWQNIYDQLQYFVKEENKGGFSPHVMFNYCSKFAYLNDIAHNWLTQSIPWEEMYKLYESNQNETDEINSIIKSYTFAGMVDSINYDALKIWSGGKDFFILPIINKTGSIGINTFNLFIPKRFCLVGCGLELSKVHNRAYPSITYSIVHDIGHYNVPLFYKLGTVPSEGMLSFYSTTINTMPELIKEYNQLNVDDKSKGLKAILSLFFVLHEMPALVSLYDSKNEKNREAISSRVNSFFWRRAGGRKITATVTYYDLFYLLFSSLDVFFLYKRAYPDLINDLKQINVEKKGGTLKRFNVNDRYGDYITYKEIDLFLKKLTFCIADAWATFVDVYGEQFNGTLPYLKDSEKNLQELRSNISRFD